VENERRRESGAHHGMNEQNETQKGSASLVGAWCCTARARRFALYDGLPWRWIEIDKNELSCSVSANGSVARV